MLYTCENNGWFTVIETDTDVERVPRLLQWMLMSFLFISVSVWVSVNKS